MIFVDRSKVAVPKFLQSKKVIDHLNQLEAMASKKDSSPISNSVLYSSTEVREALGLLFSDKCAYCEQNIHSFSLATIEHFRPKKRAMDMRGKISNLHYWWLMYEWKNLYNSCQTCNATKGSRFPVLKHRIEKGQQVEIEDALILDPCAYPDIEKHFKYYADGRIENLSYKGEITIKTIGLNRIELINKRKNAWQQIKKGFEVC